MKKDWLTPEELAKATGYSRQTINKWIKRENWTTAPKPGVQGGKARVILINDQVKSFLRSTRHAAETPGSYQITQHSLPTLLLNSIQQMSNNEQAQLTALLLREGVKGVLVRLGINDSE